MIALNNFHTHLVCLWFLILLHVFSYPQNFNGVGCLVVVSFCLCIWRFKLNLCPLLTINNTFWLVGSMYLYNNLFHNQFSCPHHPQSYPYQWFVDPVPFSKTCRLSDCLFWSCRWRDSCWCWPRVTPTMEKVPSFPYPRLPLLVLLLLLEARTSFSFHCKKYRNK